MPALRGELAQNFQELIRNSGPITFSHPDYTVGFRFSLNQHQPPAPTVFSGQIKLWEFNLGTSWHSRA